MRKKRQERFGHWMLHHDNARPHVVYIVTMEGTSRAMDHREEGNKFRGKKKKTIHNVRSLFDA
jgi:hypothetical protein